MIEIPLRLKNGARVTAEIDEVQAAKLLAPIQFNQRQAAEFLGIDPCTFRSRGYKPNPNGKYTIDYLKEFTKHA